LRALFLFFFYLNFALIPFLIHFYSYSCNMLSVFVALLLVLEICVLLNE